MHSDSVQRPALHTPAVKIIAATQATPIHRDRTPDPRCVLSCNPHTCPWRSCPTPISMVLTTITNAVGTVS